MGTNLSLGKINVLQVCNSLGLGGTEKVMQLLAANLNRDYFSCSVCAIESLGPREQLLKEQGIAVDYAGKDLKKMAGILSSRKVDLVHWHSSGQPEPFLLNAVNQVHNPPVIRTNVFGGTDSSPLAEGVSANIFVSKMCFLRYQHKHKLDLEQFYRSNKVVYNPVEFPVIDQVKLDQAEALALKSSYGINPKDRLIGRIGRADDSKFGMISIEMMRYLVKLQPNVKFIVVGITDSKMRRIKQLGISQHFIFVDPTVDNRKIYQLYHLLELYAHSAPWGESFGCSIAEAMACRKPVVTHSTPHWDNAQVELVDHGITGLVANTPRLYAQAVDLILSDPEKARSMGEAGYKKARESFEIKKITRQIERLYLNKLAEKGYGFQKELNEYFLQLEELISIEELKSFNKDYSSRLKDSFGKRNAAESLGYLVDEIMIYLKAWVHQ